MLDINIIRENLDKVKENARNRKSKVDVDEILRIDDERKKLLQQIERIRAERNSISAKGKPDESQLSHLQQLKQNLEELEPKLKELENNLFEKMTLLPNMSSPDMPIGEDELANRVLRKWGEPRHFDFQVKDHVELGELLDVIDIETAGKVSGSRFYYLKNELVLLEWAIVNFVFSTLRNEAVLKEIAEKAGLDVSIKPFVPVTPPLLIKPDTYVRMARLDETNKEERYHLEQDDLYLIGSAEHTLGPIHIDETLNEDELPKRYVGFTPSFRREAGSYGKDVRGILRVHQFDKIELESFTTPEAGQKEQDFIVAIQEHLMQALSLPYQVVQISTGDTGLPDYSQIDIETWMPAQNLYRETHSSDYNTDYQSRRLNTRVHRKDGKTELVHMNDATAFAIGRILIAIMENYQQADGSILIPEILAPYTGFSEIKHK